MKLAILTAALLGSAHSLFTPFEGTNAARVLYVCATPQPTELNQAAYAALTWVKVSAVGALGETGTSTNILTYDTWDDTVVRKQTGMQNAGDPTLEVARIPTDPGQTILRQIANNRLNYAFRVVSADSPVVGGVGTTMYTRGLVLGPTRPNGRNEDFDLEVFTLALNQKEIVVDPVVGNAPTNTALPTVTGTPKVGTQLTGANGTWVGDATITYSYQWRANGIAITGANSINYTPSSAELGKYMSLAVTGINGAGQSTAYSAPTTVVVP